MDRYNRHIILSEVGPQGQNKIADAKVLVVGAGGLGCPVLQYLAAAGVGTLGIIDFDDVEESNLQRQVLFGTSSLGINKATAAEMRLEDLNSTIAIKAYPEPLTSKNALALFKAYDIVVDGTDNFQTRYIINDASIVCNKPVVYGAIYKFEGQVSVFNYSGGPSYRCLFPTPPTDTTAVNCSQIGVLGVLPGIIGTMMANEVLKMILEFEHVLSGKLLCYSSRTAASTILKIHRNQLNFDAVLKQKEKALDSYGNGHCETRTMEISSKDVFRQHKLQFLDVRESHELPKVDLESHAQIPLSELQQHINRFDLESTWVVFCQTGTRSLEAVKLLRNKHITNSFSLKGGVKALIEELKIKT